MYQLVTDSIFGGVVAQVGSNQELITILLSSFGSIFCFAMPFYFVYLLFRSFSRLLDSIL